MTLPIWEMRAYTLEDAIVRGETRIEAIQIRKPNSGELRGFTLNDVANGRFDTMIKLLPRITMPPITENEAAELSLADMAELINIVTDFLLTKDRMAELRPI